MSTRRFLVENAPWLSAGVLLTFLSSFGQTFFISVFAGDIRAEFGLNHAAWGGIYTLGTTASAIAMLWAGALTDRWRSRSLGVIVLTALAVSCLLMASITAVWALPVIVFLLRFTGQGMMSHVAIVSMARWFVAARGRALSIAGLGIALGQAVLPVVFVWLDTIFHWRWLWVLAAGIALLAIPLVLGLLRNERTPQSLAAGAQATGMSGQHWTRLQVLRHWLFWIMVPALLGPAAFNTAFFFQQVHYAEIKGWDHLHLVALFPEFTLISVLSMIASGALLDRVGTGRILPWFQVPMVAGFACFALGESLFLTGIGLFFVALTTGANAIVPSAFWAEFYGTRHLGGIKALAAATMVLGTALGPGLTGLLIETGVGIEAQYLGIAGYFVLTTALMIPGVARAAKAL